MVGTIFTKYWYIIDAVGETLVSPFCQRHAILSGSATVRWGAVFAGAVGPGRSFLDSSVFLFPLAGHGGLLTIRLFKRSCAKLKNDNCSPFIDNLHLGLHKP